MSEPRPSSATSPSRWNPAFLRRQGDGGQAGRVFPRVLISIPARLLSALIWIYQRTVSPALIVISPTCGCRFAPTCSHYAREALQEHGLLTGATLSARRLAKCGPWHPGGLDPVPARVCRKISRSSSNFTTCRAEARRA